MTEVNSLSLKLYQMHSGFNKFIVLDGRGEADALAGKSYKSALEYLFLQNDKSAGEESFDQLLILSDSKNAQCRVTIYNADSSVSNMCANGLRCVAKLLHSELSHKSNEVHIEASGQVCRARVEGSLVSLCIAAPSVLWNEIPLARAMSTPVLNYRHGEFERPVVLNVGNPHAVFFLKDHSLNQIDLSSIGPSIENDQLFPERINVSFAKVLGDGKIEARVWERGTGETKSCGSAACAIAWGANFMGYVGSRSEIYFGPASILRVNILDDGALESSAEAVTMQTGVYDINLKKKLWKT
jgi:diaminopimelate epimerase